MQPGRVVRASMGLTVRRKPSSDDPRTHAIHCTRHTGHTALRAHGMQMACRLPPPAAACRRLPPICPSPRAEAHPLSRLAIGPFGPFGDRPPFGAGPLLAQGTFGDRPFERSALLGDRPF
eukprot:4500371-Prymnesium_polylepis.1